MTLDDHMFFGLRLDPEQAAFRDSIWDKGKEIVFCNAKAGTGKTTIAVATALLLVQYGLFKGMTYVVSPYGESKQGFLPGTIQEKSDIYFSPIYDALIACNRNPQSDVIQDCFSAQKNGTGFINCITHTYLRGNNIEDQVLIIDEAQNYTEPS